MAKPRNAFVDYLQYLALRIVNMLMHCWPIEANLKTAQLLGDLLYHVDRKHRRRALANLQRSFPQLPQRSLEQIARRSMRSLFMFFVELLFTTRLIRIDTWARYVRLDGFHEILEMLLRRRRGVILLTGHYGNFEITSYVLSTLGFATSAIARPLDNPYVNEWVMGVRQNTGSHHRQTRGHG